MWITTNKILRARMKSMTLDKPLRSSSCDIFASLLNSSAANLRRRGLRTTVQCRCGGRRHRCGSRWHGERTWRCELAGKEYLCTADWNYGEVDDRNRTMRPDIAAGGRGRPFGLLCRGGRPRRQIGKIRGLVQDLSYGPFDVNLSGYLPYRMPYRRTCC